MELPQLVVDTAAATMAPYTTVADEEAAAATVSTPPDLRPETEGRKICHVEQTPRQLSLAKVDEEAAEADEEPTPRPLSRSVNQ